MLGMFSKMPGIMLIRIRRKHIYTIIVIKLRNKCFLTGLSDLRLLAPRRRGTGLLLGLNDPNGWMYSSQKCFIPIDIASQSHCHKQQLQIKRHLVNSSLLRRNGKETGYSFSSCARNLRITSRGTP